MKFLVFNIVKKINFQLILSLLDFKKKIIFVLTNILNKSPIKYFLYNKYKAYLNIKSFSIIL